MLNLALRTETVPRWNSVAELLREVVFDGPFAPFAQGAKLAVQILGNEHTVSVTSARAGRSIARLDAVFARGLDSELGSSCALYFWAEGQPYHAPTKSQVYATVRLVRDRPTVVTAFQDEKFVTTDFGELLTNLVGRFGGVAGAVWRSGFGLVHEVWGPDRTRAALWPDAPSIRLMPPSMWNVIHPGARPVLPEAMQPLEIRSVVGPQGPRELWRLEDRPGQLRGDELAAWVGVFGVRAGRVER